MQRKYRLLREQAYMQGWDEYAVLAAQPSFTDFVCMYIGEGYKRNRNVVSIANSDPRVIRLGNHWIAKFARNPMSYWVQYHADQSLEYLRRFWAFGLGLQPSEIKLQRKSNSGGLAGRHWRSQFGVLTVCTHDTYLRARLQAWMDRLQDSWLDSINPGV